MMRARGHDLYSYDVYTVWTCILDGISSFGNVTIGLPQGQATKGSPKTEK